MSAAQSSTPRPRNRSFCRRSPLDKLPAATRRELERRLRSPEIYEKICAWLASLGCVVSDNALSCYVARMKERAASAVASHLPGRISGYDMVCEKTTEALLDEVNSRMAEGWQPHGSLLLSAGSEFLQPLVRLASEDAL